MKRLIAVLLFLCVLACVPTPEEEFVVNKGDNVAEHSIKSDQQDDAQRFPARWDEDTPLPCGTIAVSIHADIVQRADGVYPVYRTRQFPVTQAYAADLLTKLLGTPVERCRNTPTKDDWQREFQAWIDDYNAFIEGEMQQDGLSGTMETLTTEQYEQTAAWYAEQIKEAPISNEPESVSDFSSVPVNEMEARYTMQDGSTALVGVGNESDHMIRVWRNHNGGWLCLRSYYDAESKWNDGLNGQWRDTTMAQSDAETILRKTLDRLGIAGFDIADVQQANLMVDYGHNGSEYRSAAQGWGFVLKRLYGGYPAVPYAVEPSINLNYANDPAYAEVTMIREERIRIMIDESGLVCFEYHSPKEVLGMESANVGLLSFDEVQERVKNAFRASLSGSALEQIDTTEVEVYRMILTVYTVHVRNSDDYFEIPCWVVLFDDPMTRQFRDDPRIPPQMLLINAVDGSTVMPGGY